MSTYTHPVSRAIPEVVRQLAWFIVVCVVAFLVPYLGVSVLDLQHDLFYLVYFVVTIALVAAYVGVEQVDVAAIFRRRWRWSIGIGVVLAVLLVFNVFNTEDATARPHGAYFVFELLWRGVGYGLIDTLLLTIFPCFVAYKLLHGRVDGLKGKLRFTALMLPLVLVVTATYHWGYPQYRQDGLSRPETRQRPDLDPDVRDREPGRVRCRARLAARRRRHPCVRVADLQPAGNEVMTSAAQHARARRPLLGLRRQPGRLALVLMRTPRPLYHRGWGWLLDHTFLLIVHQGRKTGKRRETVAMAAGVRPGHPRGGRLLGLGPEHASGCATSGRTPRCRSRSDARPTCPSSDSSPRTRASLWCASSSAAIRGGCASSRRSSAGATSAPTKP